MLYSQSPPLAEERDRLRKIPPASSCANRSARPEPQFGRRPVNASIHSRPPQPRPSIGRRMFRAVTRFCDCGPASASAPRLAGRLTVIRQSRCSPRARRSSPGAAPYVPTTQPVAAAAPANPSLQLEPLAASLEVVRRSVEQLASQAGADGEETSRRCRPSTRRSGRRCRRRLPPRPSLWPRSPRPSPRRPKCHR